MRKGLVISVASFPSSFYLSCLVRPFLMRPKSAEFTELPAYFQPVFYGTCYLLALGQAACQEVSRVFSPS